MSGWGLGILRATNHIAKGTKDLIINLRSPGLACWLPWHPRSLHLHSCFQAWSTRGPAEQTLCCARGPHWAQRCEERGPGSLAVTDFKDLESATRPDKTEKRAANYLGFSIQLMGFKVSNFKGSWGFIH